MGYKHTPWAWQINGLTSTEKLVLLCLTTHGNNETRRTWVSITTIATECGFSRSSRNTVRKALKVLRASGYISYEDQPAGTGERQGTNTYTINWPGPGAHSTPPGAHSTGGQVLTAPGVGAHSTTNGEMNEEGWNGEANGEEVSPSPQASRDPVAPSTQASSASAAASADPVSAEFYASRERKELVRTVQRYAQTEDPEARDRVLYDLEVALHRYVSTEHPWDHYLIDMGWTPPSQCASAYRAAVWLNTLLHHVRNEDGPYQWPTLSNPDR